MFKYLFIDAVFLLTLMRGKSQECSENEIYGCKPCHQTCEFNEGVPCGKVYIECPSGCHCKKGYVYISDFDKTCIKIEECPKVCSRPNFEWKDCGPANRKICGGYLSVMNEMHSKSCVSGCFCKESYVYAFQESCKPEKNCTF